MTRQTTANDPAFPWARPHNDRFAPQVGIVALFNRCVKGIHIDMQDGAGVMGGL